MRVFPEGFFYNKKNDQTRTTKMNSLFYCIARLKGNTEEKKAGTSEVILKNYGWVAPQKLESNKIIQFFERMHLIMKTDFSSL